MYTQCDVEYSLDTLFLNGNVFAAFKVNFILRNTNMFAVNISMYTTDTQDNIYIHEQSQFVD